MRDQSKHRERERQTQRNKGILRQTDRQTESINIETEKNSERNREIGKYRER